VVGKLAEDHTSPGPGPAGTSESHIVSVDLCDEQSWDRAQLRLDAQPTGRLAVAVELWFHNPSAQTLGPIRMAVDDLCTSAGATLAGDRIRFEPSEIDEVAARSARGLAVTIAITNGPLEPGRYNGTVRVEGVPGLVIPLGIAVRDAQA
jgi:hypothetical protein